MLPLILALLLAAPVVMDGKDGPAKGAGGEAELAQVIGDRVAQKPVACIDPDDMSSLTVIDGTAIVYRNGGRLYVNRLLGDTRLLRRDDTLVTSIYGGQLCRLDSVTLVDPVTRAPHGFVVFGPFVPYLPRR